MTVENALVVDGMGLDETSGEIVLMISDHLDWSDRRAHLEALEGKTNAYLDFVQSGQVFEQCAAEQGTPVRIDVIGKFEVPEDVSWFFEAVNGAAGKIGATVSARQLPDGY